MSLVLCLPPASVAVRGEEFDSISSVRFIAPCTAQLRPAKDLFCRIQMRAKARVCMAMALPIDLSVDTAVPAVAITSLLSFAAVRAVVYFRMQYIIAAMLSRHVPRGGARVLDLNIHEGRNLYYYPKDTVQVVGISPKPNVQMLEQQAANAGVPVVVKSRPLGDLGMPSNHVDALVSVYGLCDVDDSRVSQALREGVRILKPGKPFIFVENVGAKGQLVRTAQLLLERLSRVFGSTRSYSRDLTPYILGTEGLEDLEFEDVLGFQDPHLVGVARKKIPAPTPASARSKRK